MQRRQYNGPSLTIRFRTKREYEEIKRAARIAHVSANAFIVIQAADVAQRMIKTQEDGDGSNKVR
jgi:uncharacterized protein (DUF1778 family)